MEDFSIIMIAIGLAMDSFAVSIAGGVGLRHFKWLDTFRTGLFMGIVQALFFTAGYLCGSGIAHFIHAWDHWIALVLLSAIGLKMIFEHHGEDAKKTINLRKIRILLTLSAATSIDALAVGISFSFLHYNIANTAIIIGLSSFLFAGSGVFLGHRFSKVRKFPTYLIGGCLLIAIGIKIVIEHLVNGI